MQIIATIGMILFLANVTHAKTVREEGIYRMKALGMKSENVYALMCAQKDIMVLAQNNHEDTSETEPPDYTEEEDQEEAKQEKDSPEQGKEGSDLKEFEPSEKIDAEKAVDFPADI